MSNGAVHTTWVAGSSRWKNQQENTTAALGYYDTKTEARTAGQAAARRLKVEWIGHDKDGKINERNSYGNDPFPPRG